MVEMVYKMIFWLNCFPHRDGPRAIIPGLHINHNIHCRVEFGTYVRIHEEHDDARTPCTMGAIAPRPTGNAQGAHYFLAINSRQGVACRNWTILLMPNIVITGLLPHERKIKVLFLLTRMAISSTRLKEQFKSYRSGL